MYFLIYFEAFGIMLKFFVLFFVFLICLLFFMMFSHTSYKDISLMYPASSAVTRISSRLSFFNIKLAAVRAEEELSVAMPLFSCTSGICESIGSVLHSGMIEGGEEDAGVSLAGNREHRAMAVKQVRINNPVC